MGGLISSAFFLVLLIAVVMVFLHFVPLGLWISALAANVQVSIVTLVGMRMRRHVLHSLVDLEQRQRLVAADIQDQSPCAVQRPLHQRTLDCVLNRLDHASVPALANPQ